MELLNDLRKSKKFIVFILGVLALLVFKYGLNIDDATLTKYVGLLMTYLLSQGLTDNGKEAAKINSEAAPKPETVVTQINE